MREVNPSGDAKSSAPAPRGSSPSEPPPSSARGFIGTNTDAAQAYVPPTTLPETPEPPVPNTKVALSESVDPRKAPTMPNLKKAALGIAAELKADKPAPVVEAPPDSQISSIRRGAGYAPSRGGSVPGSSVPPPRPPRPDPIPRATPAKGLRTSVRPPPAEAPETPTQRRAALLLIFLFAALLAVAVYFFLRRAPSPAADGPAPTGSATTLQSAVPSVTPRPAPAPSISAAPALTASTSAGPAAPSSPAGTGVRSSATSEPSEAPTSAPAPPSATAAPATAAPAPSGPEAPKSERWF